MNDVTEMEIKGQIITIEWNIPDSYPKGTVIKEGIPIDQIPYDPRNI